MLAVCNNTLFRFYKYDSFSSHFLLNDEFILSVKIKLINLAVVHTLQLASCEKYFQLSLRVLVVLLIQRSLISYLAMLFFSTQSTMFKKECHINIVHREFLPISLPQYAKCYLPVNYFERYKLVTL